MYSFAEKLTDFRHVQLKEDNTEAFEFFTLTRSEYPHRLNMT